MRDSYAALALLVCALWAGPAHGEPSAEDCGRCHARHYRQWLRSPHARSGTAPLFRWQEALYRADLDRRGEKDSKKREYCRGCHAPTRGKASVDCQFCHTISQVKDDADPHPELRITRGKKNVMLGPIEKPAHSVVHGSAKSELHEGPEICAACHDHDVGGVQCCTVVREWRRSEVMDYMGCQSCHMRGQREAPIVLGGEKRIYHRHDFPGASDIDQLRGGWTLELSSVARTGGGLRAVVVLTNRSGHALPNGEPFGARVVLEAVGRDEAGQIAGMTTESIGFEMLDAVGNPTLFPTQAMKVGSSNVLGSGESRTFRVEFATAVSLEVSLGYARFDPSEAAQRALEPLRDWIAEQAPQVEVELRALDGPVSALAKPIVFRRLRWAE